MNLMVTKLQFVFFAVVFIPCFLYTKVSFASADKISESSIPLVFINTSREPKPFEIEAIKNITGLLSINLKELLPVENEEKLKSDFDIAKDYFFSGEYLKSSEIFSEISNRLVEIKSSLWVYPRLQQIAFASLLYQVMVNTELEHSSDADKILETTIENFNLFNPNPVDFPPWLIDKYNKIKNSEKIVIDDSKEKNIISFLEDTTVKVINGSLIIEPLVAEQKDGISQISVLCEKMNVKEMLAVSVRFDGLKLMLYNSSENRITKEITLARYTDINEIEDALRRELTIDTNSEEGMPKETVKVSWYKDIPAWVTMAAGIGLLSTGVIIGLKYGDYSREEPVAFALQMSGIVMMATGLTLFIVPDYNIINKRIGVIAAVSVTF
ncbi:MAG: hypothetical protein JXR91_04970 [Deltaproteobacteria bacterium]|nr:hypothetical protein [Deltaproteobacteria bacterium]